MSQSHISISAREHKHFSVEIVQFCISVPNDQEVERKHNEKYKNITIEC